MSEDSIETRVALNGQKLEEMSKSLEVKHKQNRRSIHRINNELQKVTDLIYGIRIANARWNIAAGAVTATVIKLGEWFFSKH